MKTFIEQTEKLAALCNATGVEQGLDVLLQGLAEIYPDLQFNHVMTRGGWYRLGGVVDGDYARISDNISLWAEQESEGDVERLLVKHLDSGYFATRLSGKTHYFNACVGDAPEDFVQLEIEELCEVLDRSLTDPDWFPESLEEFLDPIDYPRLEPEPIGKPTYLYRRITPIHQLLHEPMRETRLLSNIRHFLEDWGQSSAGQSECFSRHWILALREYTDSDGRSIVNAKPVSAFNGDAPELPDADNLAGAKLAVAVHDYDRRVGYPFSWFFMMLSSQSKNFQLADAVLRDQAGAYDYLAARDLKVLREWEARPYSV
jgi:hypothetical protein